MKKFLITSFILGVMIVGLFVYRNEVTEIYYDLVKYFSPLDLTLEKNDYYREYDFNYVQNTVDFEPQNIDDIKNIFYTVINSGQETFSFYCPDEYTTCTSDVKMLANDQETLSDINNFVHPYNGFKHIETQYDSIGKVTITIFKNYSNEMIEEINAKVDSIIANNVPDYVSDTEKIRIIHNYIINNSKYDVERSNNNVINYKSDIAYGPLIQGYGICGGYSDAMLLFLEKFNIKSYRIASDTHVWNAVNLYGTWYHLDLTWDDPVTNTGTQILDDDYFLINTQRLHLLDTNEHMFDRNIYSEVK